MPLDMIQGVEQFHARTEQRRLKGLHARRLILLGIIPKDLEADRLLRHQYTRSLGGNGSTVIGCMRTGL